MKAGPILLLFCLCSCYLYAQQPYAVKGSLTDSAAGIKITDATISVLRAKDSTLCKFTWNNSSHNFSVPLKESGHFILLISYPGYADYTAEFSLDSTKPVYDFQGINMLLKSRLLTEVLIQGKKAEMKIKGDTTEYDASAFHVEPNAKVEDLLRQFPGMAVDKDGKITVQGKTVNKVLVDGEEFFGDDPTLVTKNIRADMVDKVQVYDRSSDQANFTGIDDGKKEKTINIKLKEDKKNGYFGKVEASGGTDKFYTGKLMFNAFKGKERFSAYGILDNTGHFGMDWGENSKYGMSNYNFNFGDDGSIRITGESNDELESYNGEYYGEGLPTARNGGLHYDNKFNNDKTTVNVNYRIGSLAVDGSKNVITQNTLPSSYINTTSDQKFHNYLFRHKGNGRFEFKLDTTSTLLVNAAGGSRNSSVDNEYNTTSLRQDSTLLNTNSRAVHSKTDETTFNAGVLFNKQLKKPGRKFSMGVSESHTSSNGNEFLNSAIHYYNEKEALDSSVINDQNRVQHSDNNTLTANATFNEPLSAKAQLAFSYDFVLTNANSNLKTYKKSGSDKYDVLDSLYSNDFKIDNVSHQGGAMFIYKTTKFRLSAGTKVSNVSFEQLNRFDNSTFKRNFVNYNPQVYFTYTFSQSKSMTLSATRRTQLPTVTQLQPVRINTDPLNVRLGNPDLNPSYSEDIYWNYNSYKAITQQYTYLNANFSLKHNSIVSNVATDSAGASTYQYANINKNGYNGGIWAMRDFKTNWWGMSFATMLSANTNVSYNMVNSILNKATSYNIAPEFTLRKNAEKKGYFELTASPNYTIQKSSLLPNLNSNGVGFTAGGEFRVYLPSNFEFYSRTSFTYTPKTKSFNTDLKRTIWNMEVSRKFLKEKQLRVAVAVNDLLNQNAGFNRDVSGSQITQNTYSTIRRYFMFTIAWDFNKMGGAKPKS
ncbi:outer membrane beta-barrel protein [Chitinophaga sp.]|uniref:outer membrane beta-barrel protein n=1 Tax=Chitinophaga sp. TaxID=1869181 RepID=UPI0031D97E22